MPAEQVLLGYFFGENWVALSDV